METIIACIVIYAVLGMVISALLNMTPLDHAKPEVNLAWLLLVATMWPVFSLELHKIRLPKSKK